MAVNDPYTGGTHMNDVAFYTPMFVDGKVLLYICVRAHWADVMPKCDECDGCGMVVCGVCKGTGKNLEDKFEDDGKDAAVLNSAVYVSNSKGHPCWVCRGLATMACGKCDGTGLSTTMDMISGD